MNANIPKIRVAAALGMRILELRPFKRSSMMTAKMMLRYMALIENPESRGLATQSETEVNVSSNGKM